jgi:hypothetical protein
MIKQRIVFIAGILIALLPYSGFPVSWKNTFFVFFGLSITLLAYLLYREKKASLSEKKEGQGTFTDNRAKIKDIQSRIVE